MGSLTSRPKLPTHQPIVYAPTPVTTVNTSDAAAQSDQTSQQEQNDAQPSADEKREQNLLLRTRGRQGTVLTSFRGILSDFTNPSSRKTLLGE